MYRKGQTLPGLVQADAEAAARRVATRRSARVEASPVYPASPGAASAPGGGGFSQQAAGIATVAGVGEPGGDVELAAGGAISITPDAGNERITIGETHSGRTDNPHQVTAAQAGADPAGTATAAVTTHEGETDPHTIYALLNGRAGGQTLIGGTAAGNNLTLQSTSHATRGMIVLADPTLGHSSTHAAAKPALANNHCGIALEHDPNNESVLVYGYAYGSNPIFQVAKKGYTGTPLAAWDPSANIQFQVSADGSAWFAGNVESDGLLKVLTAGAAGEGMTRIVDLWDSTAYAAGVGAGIRFSGKYSTGEADYAGFGGIRGVKANDTIGNNAGELVLYARAHGANITEGARLAVGTDATRGLTVRQDSADANEAVIRLLKSRSGGAVSDDDYAGGVSFEAMNDAGTPERIVYADIRGRVVDASDGSEDGRLYFRAMKAGSLYVAGYMDGDEFYTQVPITSNAAIRSNANFNCGGVDGSNGNFSVATPGGGSVTLTFVGGILTAIT